MTSVSATLVQITIGKALAGALANIALANHSFTKSVATAAIDIAAAVLGKAGSREFEATVRQIADAVADDIVKLFAHDGAHLPEGERNAALFVLAGALESADMSPKSLAATDYDGVALDRVLAKATPSDADLSSSARAFLQRARFETALSICRVASQLPGFEEANANESLTRLRLLADDVSRILAELRSLRSVATSDSGSGRTDRFEQTYRAAILQNWAHMELFGVDLLRATRRYPLTVAYVVARLSRSDKDDADHCTPEALLANHARLLITGLPGSGKTTLLQWVALAAARGEWQTKNGSERSVPFMIRLRATAQTGLPTVEGLANHTAPVVAASAPDRWILATLLGGRAIILIDGVDEVLPERRGAVRDWIAEICAAYPEVRIVVTSRPGAIDAAWLVELGFTHATIEPLSSSGIRELVLHWHAAVQPCKTPESLSVAMLALANRLLAQIEESSPLLSLARTPLLCALLCALHYERNEEIPKDRITLYRACCGMLLDRRDQERKIESVLDASLETRPRWHIVQKFAYWLLRNGWSEISEEQALTFFATHLETINVEKAPKPSDLVQWLVERSGIIRTPAHGRLDFIHKTFQEFLAACAAVDEGDTGLLAENAHDASWREVVILAMGLGTRAFREELLRELLRRGTEGRLRHEYDFLAAACLKTAVEIPPDVRAEVKRRIANLVPPTTMRDAELLAAAGDLAVPYLVHQSRSRARTKAACVRALTEIGTKRALSALLAYTSNRTSTVRRELRRAFYRFQHDPDALRLVLHEGRIAVEASREFAGFAAIRNLREVSVGHYEGSLSPLEESWASELESITLGSVDAGGPVTLPVLPQRLKELQIGRFWPGSHLVGGVQFQSARAFGPLDLADGRSLESLSCLESLSVAVRDAASLSSILLPPTLRKVEIMSVEGNIDLRLIQRIADKVVDLALLAPGVAVDEPLYAPLLAKLHLQYSDESVDDVIEAMRTESLVELTLDRRGVPNVRGLPRMPGSVKGLQIAGAFDSLAGLRGCMHLERAAIHLTGVSRVDILALKGLPALRMIQLSGLPEGCAETLKSFSPEFNVRVARRGRSGLTGFCKRVSKSPGE